jgi:hypothetical protein
MKIIKIRIQNIHMKVSTILVIFVAFSGLVSSKLFLGERLV